MSALRVLVTGAAGGIGTAVVERLRAQGHGVIGLDLRPGPGRVSADLRDEAGTREAVRSAIAQLGGLDVLVNNAGVAELQDSGAPPSEGVRDVMDVNFFGAWTVTSAALPALVESHGRVVNVASMLAFLPLPLLAGYAASKRALSALSDVLRVEFAGCLSVVTVYPGYVRTPLHAVAHRNNLTLDGMVPEESLAQVADVITRACTGPPRRDVATSWSGALAMRTARWFPSVLDRVAAWQIERLAARGDFDGATVARPLVRRLSTD